MVVSLKHGCLKLRLIDSTRLEVNPQCPSHSRIISFTLEPQDMPSGVLVLAKDSTMQNAMVALKVGDIPQLTTSVRQRPGTQYRTKRDRSFTCGVQVMQAGNHGLLCPRWNGMLATPFPKRVYHIPPCIRRNCPRIDASRSSWGQASTRACHHRSQGLCVWLAQIVPSHVQGIQQEECV